MSELRFMQGIKITCVGKIFTAVSGLAQEITFDDDDNSPSMYRLTMLSQVLGFLVFPSAFKTISCFQFSRMLN